MRFRFVLALLTLSLGAYGVVVLLRAQTEERSSRMPEIKIDKAAIDRSNHVVVTSYADALEEIRHSVVSVFSSKTIRTTRGDGFPFDDPFFRRFFGPGGGQQQQDRIQQGLGSGVVVSADGFILTNNHVIEGSDEIRVSLADGRELTARIVGADPRTDVAIVKVDATDLKFATLADSDQLRVGDIVFAVGNPLAVGQTTTMGIVSATGRSNLRLIDEGYENFIQTDASINPGNSGGALVDAAGRVVGINTAILSRSGGNIGIGFAIPINLAASIMRSLVETGAVARGFLGVSLQDLDSDLGQEFGVTDGKGVVVVDVQAGSPAETAGLKQGDVITRIGGRAIANSSDLRLTVSQMLPGTTVTVGVLRNNTVEDVDIVLGRLEERTNFSGVPTNELVEGIKIAPLSAELRQQFNLAEGGRGVVVIEAATGSRFAAVLPVGTVIEQINRQPVVDVRSAREALGRGRNIVLLNFRGVYRYVAITIN